MFDVEERDRVRTRLLELAAADGDTPAAAITGSGAAGGTDRWSDIDLAVAVRGDLAAALGRWTDLIYRDFAALHHWDLPSGSSVYRVFLLPGGLEVDIGFTPEADFAARGPNWRLVFGAPGRLPAAAAGPDNLVGLAWHHVLHARACIERGRPWQAEWLIGGVRDHVITLACRRLGLPASYAKGADLLPAQLTAPLVATLVRSLDADELRRALAAATAALLSELDRTVPDLAARLRPVLLDFSAAPSAPG